MEEERWPLHPRDVRRFRRAAWRLARYRNRRFRREHIGLEVCSVVAVGVADVVSQAARAGPMSWDSLRTILVAILGLLLVVGVNALTEWWRAPARIARRLKAERDAARRAFAQRRSDQYWKDVFMYGTACLFTQFGKTYVLAQMPPDTCTPLALNAWFETWVKQWQPIALYALEQSCGLGAKSRVEPVWASGETWTSARATLTTMIEQMEHELRALESRPGFELVKISTMSSTPPESPFQSQAWGQILEEIKKRAAQEP